MTNVLLTALSQPSLEAGATTVTSRRRTPPRPVQWGSLPPVTEGAVEVADRRAFALALAEAFETLEALEIGRDVASCPGFTEGDVILVDWSSSAATLTASRTALGAVHLNVGPATEGQDTGAVFAVVRATQ